MRIALRRWCTARVASTNTKGRRQHDHRRLQVPEILTLDQRPLVDLILVNQRSRSPCPSLPYRIRPSVSRSAGRADC